MKRVKSLIKLTNRNWESLNEKEQRLVIGGYCVCCCYYEKCGGPGTFDVGDANMELDLHSEPGPQVEWNYVI